MSTPNKPGKGLSGPGRRATIWRLTWTWIQTLLAIAVMGGLTAGALLHFGLHFSWAVAVLSLTMILPLVSWYFSSTFVKHLMGCKPADPLNENHARLIRIVNRLYPKTGLPVKPPVFVSPLKVPNAFATGRTPGDAFIAATEGLFLLDLTDDEMEAVLAHELAHVKHYDVAINSMLAVMASLFGLVLATALPRLFHPASITGKAPLLDKLSNRIKNKRQRLFLPVGGFFGFLIMLVVFYIVSFFTKLIGLFVTRTRESAADAQAALWTGKPCALSSALQKITLFMMIHAVDIRHNILTRGLTPLLFISSFDEDDRQPDSPLPQRRRPSRLGRWWRGLGQNHPPTAVRMEALDKMNGGSCPRII